jgi:hypothetical protein
MTRDKTMAQKLPDSRGSTEQEDARWPNTQFRCLCCNGVIMSLFDQDVSGGLDLKMGLVFDEYSFICDGCAAALIADQAHRPRPTRKGP